MPGRGKTTLSGRGGTCADERQIQEDAINRRKKTKAYIKKKDKRTKKKGPPEMFAHETNAIG